MKKGKIKIPSSSLSEIKRIIKGYAHQIEAIGLDQIAKLIKMNRSMVSRNSKFLIQIGIIEGGKTKKCTEIGKNIGRALEHNRLNEIKKGWQKIVQANDFLSNLISTVSMQTNSRMAGDDFIAHILYVADLTKNQFTTAGARALLDMFLEAELLKEIDGQIEVAKPSMETKEQQGNKGIKETTVEEPEDQGPKRHLVSSPTININIQLALPETEKPEVYENLFKALRKYLMDSDAE